MLPRIYSLALCEIGKHLSDFLLHDFNRARFFQFDFGRAFVNHDFASDGDFLAFELIQIGKGAEVFGIDRAHNGIFIILGEVEQNDAVAFDDENAVNGADESHGFADQLFGSGQIGGGFGAFSTSAALTVGNAPLAATFDCGGPAGFLALELPALGGLTGNCLFKSCA